MGSSEGADFNGVVCGVAIGRPEGQILMVLCAECAEYAQVLRMLGNGRLEAQCIDGTKRLCHIRGKMRKKVWVNMVCTTQWLSPISFLTLGMRRP